MWKSTYLLGLQERRAVAAEFKRTGGGRAAAAPFRLETHIFYLLSGVLALRNRALNAELRKFGLDYPRWRVLAVLSEYPGCSMLRLAELTAADRTSLSHTIRLMEAGNLVSRAARSGDRRSIALKLTRRGRAQLSKILPAVISLNDQALKGFSADDAAVLRLSLSRISANFQSEGPSQLLRRQTAPRAVSAGGFSGRAVERPPGT